jgi:hypothetical protein
MNMHGMGARYLYIKINVEKVWGVRYLPENTVIVALDCTFLLFYVFLVSSGMDYPKVKVCACVICK